MACELFSDIIGLTIDNYFYGEELTLRKSSLETQEVANTVCFLLSPKSSGINASTLIVDAGMSSNYFDQNIVKAFNKK
jgi:enoyl-[acyl-carrier protein] reductase I